MTPEQVQELRELAFGLDENYPYQPVGRNLIPHRAAAALRACAEREERALAETDGDLVKALLAARTTLLALQYGPRSRIIRQINTALAAHESSAQGVGDGWKAMTERAREIQARHLDRHEGDVYHAMQSLCVKYGYRDDAPLFAAAPTKGG